MSEVIHLQVKVGERLATLEVQVKGLEGDIIEFKDSYVTSDRFKYIEKLTYGLILACGSVLGWFATLVLDKITL